MAAKSTGKTKAQDLQRIRNNQQRSRDRKRAYIAQLENDVRRLTEELRQREPHGMSRTKLDDSVVESEARKELLKALGIDDAAQEQFVQAFAKRNVAKQSMEDLQAVVDGTKCSSTSSHDAVPAPSTCLRDCSARRQANNAARKVLELSSVGAPTSVDHGPSSRVLEDLDTVASSRASTASPIETLASPDLQAVKPYEDSSSQQQVLDPGSLMRLCSPPEQQTLWTPCLLNSSLQGSQTCSESMTGCSIAFSMLLSNNIRGYTFADINARLQAAYRRDNSVAEGCSVLNKVLFQLLSEIS